VDAAQRAQLQDLLTRLADGDRTAFPALFERVWPLLRRFAERALPGAGAGEAEDAAQQALLKVFARAATFDPQKPALSWILALAVWECRTVRRRALRRREQADAPLEHLAAPEKSPEQALVERDLEAALAEAVGGLRPSDAETIRAALAGCAPAGVAAATFRKRLERALGRLRTAWRARHDAE